MSERPDIGRMIEEELAKSGKPEEGKKPLEVGPEGAINEAANDDIDDAFDAIKADDAKESRDAAKVADLGGDAARRIQMAFEKGDARSVADVAKDFVAKAQTLGASEDEAKATLREQLKAYHDTYFEAGLKEKAAEIDAFSRSLESKGDVSTPAGKEFLAKLDAGGFDSIEAAINALDGIKNAAKGEDEEKMNAEFNVLYAKINDKFLGSNQSGEHKIDMGEDDIDDVLSALG
ncbi:MAG TPA: hypothetical protein VL426_07580 [Candidatus Binatia bacterium]|jgi:hypothetical protein|nr:hypothetical protein [Candidatus Binatia bacterium]